MKRAVQYPTAEAQIGTRANKSAHATLWSLQARFAPYLFVAPFVILFCVFMLYPLGRSIVMSLYRTYGPRTSQFIGLSHYRFFLTDFLLWIAVANTILYTLAIVSLQVPLSLGLALLLNSPRVRLRNLFRFAFFAPYLVGNVFVAVIFMLLLAQRHGLIPRAMGLFNSDWLETSWLGDPVNARIAIILASLWLSVGWGMVFFLAALQGVDRELYEAAEVDGAGRWSRFWHVTLPGIKPVTTFLVVTGTIGAFQLFELPYILFMQHGSAAGPRWAGLTIVMYLYQQGFDAGDLGAACALGWFLVIMILAVALAQIRLFGAGREE
ncbi:MAG TPA: sugar ABC transporter permease [Tepidisphaeraceae bacterium]|jgi:ABC-type sugar transport system permease subunit